MRYSTTKQENESVAGIFDASNHFPKVPRLAGPCTSGSTTSTTPAVTLELGGSVVGPRQESIGRLATAPDQTGTKLRVVAR